MQASDTAEVRAEVTYRERALPWAGAHGGTSGVLALFLVLT